MSASAAPGPPTAIASSDVSLSRVSVTEVLGLPTFLVAYANAGNRQHARNEHLRLDHLLQGIRTTAQLLRDLGS